MRRFRNLAVALFAAALLTSASVFADVVVASGSSATSLDDSSGLSSGASPSPSPSINPDSGTLVTTVAADNSASPSPGADGAASPAPSPTPSSSASPSPAPSTSSSPSPSPDANVATPGSLPDFGPALSSVDFSKATISQAGPNALYIRGVLVQGVQASLLFKKDNDDQWKIAEAVPEEKNFFPAGLVLDFARLEKLSDGSLQLDGIMLEGKPYSAVIQVSADNTLSLSLPLQAGSLVGSSLTRARTIAQYALKDELSEAAANKQKIDENERLNQDMLAKIGNLESAAKLNDDEKTKLNTQISTLADRNKALEQEVSDLNGQIETLKSAGGTVANTGAVQDAETKKVLDSLSANVVTLQTKVKALEDKLSALNGASSTPGATTSAETQALRDEIARLTTLNEKLMGERQDIERNLRLQFLSSGYIATAKPDLGRTVLSGFNNAKSRIGPWKVTPTSAQQNDTSQYFAQLDLPLVQHKETLLYSFTAKSTGKGWAGLGLHIYASGAEKRGYGHGESLLVWLTRDPDYYKNNGTYLQLYRSDNDVNMGRVLDSAIQDSLSSDLKIEILYQPVEEYITVAINGVEKIRYKTWFSIDDGVEVSLRSLNSAVFGSLQVTAPNPR